MHSDTVTHSHAISFARAVAASVVFVVMLFTALALWTLIPLGWVWIGSQVSSSQFPAVGPYMVVFAGIVATIVLVAYLLGRLNDLYMRITGTNKLHPMRPGWLRSMRDTGGEAGSTTVVEAVLVGSVVLAGLVFVAWFFLLAGSPLPQG